MEKEKVEMYKPIWFIALVSIITAVSTQQVLDGNLIYNTKSKHNLKLDTATVTLIKTSETGYKSEDVLINFLSDQCYNCAYYTATKLDRHHYNTTFVVDTRWGTSIQFVTSSCNKTVYKHFGEYGSYQVELSFDTVGRCNVSSVAIIKNPINSNIPILIAFCSILGLALLFNLLECSLYKLTKRKNKDFSPIVEDNDSSDKKEENEVKQNENKEKRERLKSIDTFRGLCLILMIFVNFRGGNYWFFRHSKWNGLTVADLVFPWFMFLMGVNIPLSLESLIQKKLSKTLICYKAVRRTLILFAIGIFIINHNTSWSSIRIPGVLQRFSIAYFVSFFLQWPVHVTRENMELAFSESKLKPFQDIIKYWSHMIAILLLETVWLCITFLLPVPGCPTGYLGPGGLADNGKLLNNSCVGGAAGYIDRWLFGENHMYGHPTCKEVYYPTYTSEQKVYFDPEGLLGSINGCVIVLLGCQAGRIFLYYKSTKSRITRWMLWSVILGIISIILCKSSQNEGFIPVNKNLWSTTYVTTMACMAFFNLTVFYILTDVFKFWSGKPLDFVGMNSILLYVGHEVFSDYVPFSWGITQHDTHMKWIAMNMIGVGYWVLIAYYCYKIKFFLKI